MFKSARLKLTAWYLFIIMLVSLFFSLVIYRVLTAELDRFAQMQQNRYERRLQNSQFLPPPPYIDLELITDFKKRVIISLLIINSSILIFSGCFGYVLAGKTLEPIQDMVEDQKRFISDASHELRTPITALKTTLEVALRDKKMTVKTALDLINQNLEDVNKLQQLSDSLLQLSGLSQNQHLQLKQISIANLIKESIAKVKPLANQKQIKIKSQVTKSSICGDLQSLQSVMVILLDNAIKYSHLKSEIKVSTSIQNNWVIIKIQDQGEGIASQELPHIFDRFYRADSARSQHNGQGYGLGLAIAQRLIASHNGVIEAQSKLGQGSTFTIKLPLIKS